MAPGSESVDGFVAGIADATQQADARRLIDMLRDVTGHEPAMWGPSIVGFDSYHYKYESGREGDMAAIGFSPRAASLTVYLVDGTDPYAELLDRLGPHRTGKACLYVKRLDDVDTGVLEEIARRSYASVVSRRDDMHRAE